MSGEVTFGLSGQGKPIPEISVSGKRVSLISIDGQADRYAQIAPHLTPRVAEAALTELTRELPPTKSRVQWLKQHPGPLDTSEWSTGELRAEAMMTKLSKYPEEQRTHGGKQMRGGLRTVAQGKKKAARVFVGAHPMVPQAHSIVQLRAAFDAWIRLHTPSARPGRTSVPEMVDLSDSSDLEDEMVEYLQVDDMDDDLAVVIAARNNIAPPPQRKRDALTDRFVEEKPARRSTRLAGRAKTVQRQPKRPREEDDSGDEAPVNKKMRRDDAADDSMVARMKGDGPALRPRRTTRGASATAYDADDETDPPSMAQRMARKRSSSQVDVAPSKRSLKLQRTSPKVGAVHTALRRSDHRPIVPPKASAGAGPDRVAIGVA